MLSDFYRTAIINIIEVVVEYKNGNKVKKFNTTVSFTMEGVYSCGNVTIDSPDLPETEYHTEFKSTFQTYKFDAAYNSLII